MSDDGLNSQLYAAARRLAEQLSQGMLELFPDDEAAASKRLSAHIAAGDIDQKTVDEIYAAARVQ